MEAPHDGSIATVERHRERETSSAGEQLHRLDLSTEAIRLTRMVHHSLPKDGEVTGLLALTLLTDVIRRASLLR